MGIGWAFGETVEQLVATVLSDPTPAVIAAAGVGGLVVVLLALRFRRRLAPVIAGPAARVSERLTRRGG